VQSPDFKPQYRTRRRRRRKKKKKGRRGGEKAREGEEEEYQRSRLVGAAFILFIETI
jgi:hypothetical protein